MKTQFNGLEITSDAMFKTRKHFIDLSIESIQEVLNGNIKVNDFNDFIKWKTNTIKLINNGGSDHTFTFMQHAHYIQTGNTIALLP